MKTLILGIGNTLLADDGAGVHAVQALRLMHGKEDCCFDDVELLDGGTLGFSLCGAIEDAEHLIVIDASDLKEPPGTVRHFIDQAMDDYLGGSGGRSVHEVSLVDLLTMARLSDRLPKRRALIGIQPKTIDWGNTPTEEVCSGIEQARDVALQLMREWST